jgi:hypothetical protein
MRLFVFGRKAHFALCSAFCLSLAAARFDARAQSRKMNRDQWARLDSSELT